MGAVCKLTRVARTGVLALGIAGAMAFGASADAGVLNGHAAAYNDGTAWTGSTAFDNGLGVAGTIDWAVFGPGDFPYAGYSPTGADAIHSLTLNDPNNAANNVGAFADLAGEAPISMAIGTQVEWNFAGLDTGDNSTGLAFSSIKTPDTLFGIVHNGGSFAVAVPLPVPGPNDIPEPASLALLGAGGLMMLRRR